MRLIEKDGRLHCEKHGEITIVAPPKAGDNGHGVVPMCLKCKRLIDEGICIDCEKHKWSVHFAEGPLAAELGIFDFLCRCCEILRHEARIEHSNKIIAQVKAQMLVTPCVAVVSTEKVQ